MFEDYPVELTMKHVILEGGYYDDGTYSGVVDYYDKEDKLLYIDVKNDVSLFSLDAIYKVKVMADQDSYYCEGVIEERYWLKDKKKVVLAIHKGFNKM
ncbi:MAG TPA: hypothetical protein H9887_06660 [Candidatus Dorea intestinavium]|nr:hypothetical protein [Candidatus Dorea intestinavium]